MHAAPTAAGLRAVMPRSPRFRDDEFDVPITAHTNPIPIEGPSTSPSLLGFPATLPPDQRISYSDISPVLI